MRNVAFNHFNCVLSLKPFLELLFCSVTQGMAEVTGYVIILTSSTRRYITTPFHTHFSQQQEGPPPLILVRTHLGLFWVWEPRFSLKPLMSFFFSAWSSTARDTLKSVCFSYLSSCAPKMSLKVAPKSILTLRPLLKMNVIAWDKKN